MNTLEEYGKLFAELGLTEMSVKDGTLELVLKKEIPVGTTQTVSEKEIPAGMAQTVSEKENVVSPKAAAALKEEADISEPALEICSPLVGVFCSGEGPDAKPYVEVGDVVKKGDVVCTIEAMKMFNDVAADKDGIIKEICVENGSLVEFKQTLFRLGPKAESVI